VRCAGIEGTSSHGAGLARQLKTRGIEVLEVERPKRRRRSSRRHLKKSDPSDAESAARAVLAGEASGVPKCGDGCVEMIRALRAARRSAMKARTQAANQLKGVHKEAGGPCVLRPPRGRPSPSPSTASASTVAVQPRGR